MAHKVTVTIRDDSTFRFEITRDNSETGGDLLFACTGRVESRDFDPWILLSMIQRFLGRK